MSHLTYACGSETILQIREIVLYSYQGQKRSFSLTPGTPNIITGASSTEKTVNHLCRLLPLPGFLHDSR